MNPSFLRFPGRRVYEGHLLALSAPFPNLWSLVIAPACVVLTGCIGDVFEL